MKNSSSVNFDQNLENKSNFFPEFDETDLAPYNEGSLKRSDPSDNNLKDNSVVSFREMQNIVIPQMPKPIHRRMPTFNTSSLWECEVVEIEDSKSFLGRIHNSDGGGNSDDYVEFSFSEVNKSDWKYIHKGAIFNWHVGHEVTSKGQFKNTSLVVFRVMPVWKNRKKEAEKKANFFVDLVKKYSK